MLMLRVFEHIWVPRNMADNSGSQLKAQTSFWLHLFLLLSFFCATTRMSTSWRSLTTEVFALQKVVMRLTSLFPPSRRRSKRPWSSFHPTCVLHSLLLLVVSWSSGYHFRPPELVISDFLFLLAHTFYFLHVAVEFMQLTLIFSLTWYNPKLARLPKRWQNRSPLFSVDCSNVCFLVCFGTCWCTSFVRVSTLPEVCEIPLFSCFVS